MKISDVKIYPTWVGARNQLIIKIETDAGIHGWGESGLSGRELAVAGALQHYREILVGQDPMNIGYLWQLLYRSQYFEGGRVLTAAQSAIDIALHDIKGKALGVPIWQLLGGMQRDRIPTFVTIQLGKTMVQQAKRFMKKGWNVIRTGVNAGYSEPAQGKKSTGGAARKIKGGDVFEPLESLAATAVHLTELRDALGPAVLLGTDFHHRLSVAEAAHFCQRMPKGTLDFLEEPIRDETPEAYEQLRRMTDVPFAIGEEFSSKWQFLPYIERGITNYARLDICNVGGFTEAMKVAGWCEAHYIDLMPHNPLGPICTMATIHLAAAVPNFSHLEVWVREDGTLGHFDAEIFSHQPQLDGAAFPVPTAPGLGVEFNEDYAKAHEFKFWEAPKLYRKDGSVQNW
jgi:galactonate dehydratase